MCEIEFSLSDYQESLSKGLFNPPNALCPFIETDPELYGQMGTTTQRRHNLRLAVDEIRMRTDAQYFRKTYPLQGRTLSYSGRAFPAYRFILPEVITEDWLAIVDWGKFQRDHVLHQPLCGYVVSKLLDGDGTEGPLLLPNGETLLDAGVKSILRWEETAFIKEFLINCGMKKEDPILESNSPIASNVWRCFLKEALYVAAVFHDLGYPWQYAERVQGNLDGMNSPAVKRNQSVTQIIEKFGYRILFQALQGYCVPNKACPSTWAEKVAHLTDIALSSTHGLPGALGFLHLNDCVRRYPPTKQSPLHLLCIEWVAAAIMLHDMGKIYWGTGRGEDKSPENSFLRLSFKKDPLSAILTLTDVLEDFERPTAVFSLDDNGIRDVVSINYEAACSKTTLKMNGNTMTISYFMNSDAARAKKRNCLVDDQRMYFDYEHGYLDMSSLGITNVDLVAC